MRKENGINIRKYYQNSRQTVKRRRKNGMKEVKTKKIKKGSPS